MPRDDYKEHQERRHDRLLERADKADAESAVRHERSNNLAEVMNGQPILIGHHSEKRHRRDLERMQTDGRKAFELANKATALRSSAATIEAGGGGISSDDPEAVRLLKEKLEAMETRRDKMKALNAAWRKADKPDADNVEGWKAVGDGTTLDADKLRAAFGRMDDWDQRHGPIASWQISNLGANIRTAKKRIESLLVEAETTATGDVEIFYAGPGAVTYRENVDANRVQLVFLGKPGAEDRALLKRHGFRWAPSQGAWQRQLNNAGRANGKDVATILQRQHT